MARPSPSVLVVILLGMIDFVAVYPRSPATALLAAVIILIALCGWEIARSKTRRSLLRSVLFKARRVLWGGLVVLVTMAFGVLFFVAPTLRTTYRPDQLEHAPELASFRGFYPTERDAAGNRYAWTQDRATLVFDFLVRKPLTLTVTMRSAAIGGGPDAPVRVIVNDVEVAQLRPNPANSSFQPNSVKFTSNDWGGRQTEIKLLATTFQPGMADSRMLGTMVQAITVDKTEAWSSVSRHNVTPGAFAAFTMLAVAFVFMARRSRSALLGYGAIAACSIGVGCAIILIALVLRLGVIDVFVYRAWLASGVFLAFCFIVATMILPFGTPDRPSIWRYARSWVIGLPVWAYLHSITQPARLPRVTLALSPDKRRKAIIGDLAIVFLLAFSIRVVWATVSPPWSAPDEPDHYLYVSHIVEQADIPHPPSLDLPYYSVEEEHSGGVTLSGELSPGKSGLPERVFPYYPLRYDYRTAREYTAPTLDRFSQAGGRATGYPGLYYLVSALPYKLLQSAPIVSRLFAVRCASALFGAFSCVFGYLLAFEVRRERRWGWALGTTMALLPMYVFDTAVANNDAAMNCFATMLIWLMARAWMRPAVSVRLAFAIGAAAGLMLFSKPTALILVPIGAGVVFIKALPALRSILQQVRHRALMTGIYAAGVFAGYGPWLLFHLYYYGDVGIGGIPILSLFRRGSASTAPVAAIAPVYSLQLYLHYEQKQGWDYFQWLFVKSFWGFFGWLDTPLADPVYRVITIVCLIGAIGFTIQCMLQPKRRLILVLLLSMVVGHSLFLFLIPDYYVSFRTSGVTLGLQGRYFFPIIAPFLLILLSGWDHLFREHPIAIRGVPFVMVGLQVIALATVVAVYLGVIIG